jgi:hypothetical protein
MIWVRIIMCKFVSLLLFTETFNYLFDRFALISLQLFNLLLLLLMLLGHRLRLLNFMLLFCCDLLYPVEVKCIWVPLLWVPFLLLLILKWSIRILIIVDTNAITLSKGLFKETHVLGTNCLVKTWFCLWNWLS